MVPNNIISPVDDSGESYAKPDLSQMIPFKPRRFPAPGSHPVAGGEYPMPEGGYIIFGKFLMNFLAAHNVLKLMPPPVCFHGPFVRVDDLIAKFRSSELPEKSEFFKIKK